VAEDTVVALLAERDLLLGAVRELGVEVTLLRMGLDVVSPLDLAAYDMPGRSGRTHDKRSARRCSTPA